MQYFSSDWHLGHYRSIQFSNRPFKDVDEMDSTIIHNMISPLKKGDDFYFLGDLAFNVASAAKFFNQLPKGVKFFWILGNHERTASHFIHHCVQQIPIKEIKIRGTSVTLCHYPMITWNKSHYNAWQLFGHHHVSSHGHDKIHHLASGKQLNVNLEFHDYKPWTEDEIVEYMESRPDNWDLIIDKTRLKENKT